jgi:hypothetical protein
MDAFIPAYGTGVVGDASNTSARHAINTSPRFLLLTNKSSSHVVYFRPGDSAVVATAADVAVAPFSQLLIWVDGRFTHVAYLSASGNTPIHTIGGELMPA